MATLQLNNVARETDDVRRLAAFYEEVLGFERITSPNYSGFQVAWLRLPGTPGVALHIIERDPAAAPAAVAPGAASAPPAQLPRRHHLAFSVADYDGVPRRAEGARHGRVREDAARRAHAPGLLLRPRWQWSRSYKLRHRR